MKQLIYLLIFTGTAVFAQEKTPLQPNSKPTPQTAVTPASQPIASATAPEITFTETSHDFGTLKKGSPVVCKFQYKNTGKEPLLIFNCKAGCGCTTPKCSKEPVKRGKTGFIEVHYDSMRVGNFIKEVMVTSNAKNGIVNLVIKGNIEGTEGNETKPVKKEENTKSPVENKME